MSLYNNDIASYIENLEYIEQQLAEYVVIAPSYMIYTQDYNKLLNTHIESGADITLLYHSVDNAKEYFLNCYACEPEQAERSSFTGTKSRKCKE